MGFAGRSYGIEFRLSAVGVGCIYAEAETVSGDGTLRCGCRHPDNRYADCRLRPAVGPGKEGRTASCGTLPQEKQELTDTVNHSPLPTDPNGAVQPQPADKEAL